MSGLGCHSANRDPHARVTKSTSCAVGSSMPTMTTRSIRALSNGSHQCLEHDNDCVVRGNVFFPLAKADETKKQLESSASSVIGKSAAVFPIHRSPASRVSPIGKGREEGELMKSTEEVCQAQRAVLAVFAPDINENSSPQGHDPLHLEKKSPQEQSKKRKTVVHEKDHDQVKECNDVGAIGDGGVGRPEPPNTFFRPASCADDILPAVENCRTIAVGTDVSVATDGNRRDANRDVLPRSQNIDYSAGPSEQQSSDPDKETQHKVQLHAKLVRSLPPMQVQDFESEESAGRPGTSRYHCQAGGGGMEHDGGRLGRTEKNPADVNSVNPLKPCGSCMEWLKKIAEVNPDFKVITFTDTSCQGVYVVDVAQIV